MRTPTCELHPGIRLNPTCYKCGPKEALMELTEDILREELALQPAADYGDVIRRCPMSDRIKQLNRIVKLTRNLSDYIPEIGEKTCCYDENGDRQRGHPLSYIEVTQEMQDVIWKRSNEKDEALAALGLDETP